MICHLDPQQHMQHFQNIPAILHGKRAAELQEAWTAQYGVTFPAFGPGYLVANFANSKREQIMQFLETAGIAAVDLQPMDVLYLWGHKDALSLSIVESLQTNPEAQRFLSLLTPEEIFPKLEELAVASLKKTSELNVLDEEMAVARMKAAGVTVPEDQSAGLEPAPERQPTTENDEAYGLVPLSPDHDLFSVADSMPGIGGY